MGFWVFMLIVDLLIPGVMIGFGQRFLTRPPREINGLYGYRSSRSMKNQETWGFAHEYCGRLWRVVGVALLPATAVPMVLVLGRNVTAVSVVGLLICLIQCVALLIPLFCTERALKRTFDENGRRKT